MRKTIIIILTFILAGCGSKDMSTNQFSTDCVTTRIEQIKGTWAYYEDPNQYVELEISDSLYWYIDDGEYRGSLIGLEYELQGDSLFTLYDDGEKNRRWKICYQDSLTIRIKNQFDYFICKRIYPRLKISDFSENDRKLYSNEFLKRKKEFQMSK